jgi:hypothetical protein
VADVVALVSPKYEDRAKNVAEVANIAGGRLPRSPVALAAAEPAPAVETAEREAIAIELGGVAEAYACAFAGLQVHAPPEVPIDRWHQFINDAGIFLDQWGREAEGRAGERMNCLASIRLRRWPDTTEWGSSGCLRASVSLLSRQQR